MPNHDITLTTTIAVRPPRPQLVRLLDTAPQLGPEHHWEGEFAGSRGITTNYVIRMKARIAFHGVLIEGNGRLVDCPGAGPDLDVSFNLSGTIGVGTVDFQIWFAAAEVRRVPLLGSGLLSADEKEMSGDWSVQCFNPDTCGCEGGGGSFLLNRID